MKSKASRRGNIVADGWLEWMACKSKENISNFNNSGEVSLDERSPPAAECGLSSFIVIQVYSCFWHSICVSRNTG